MLSRSILIFGLLSLSHLLEPVAARSTRHGLIRRQDQTDDGGDGSDATGGDDTGDGSDGGDTAPSESASVAPSASASASASAGAGGGEANVGNLLGGAGQGGGVPTACASCEGTYESIIACTAQGTAATCSPLCSNYTSTVSCLSCLVSNGQPDIDQIGAQQVLWNLEASCSSLGTELATQEITAAPTATGPFTTPPGSSGMPSSSGPSTSHSGITVYNTQIQPFSATGEISTSQAVNPTGGAKTSGAARPNAGVVDGSITLLLSASAVLGLGYGIGFFATLF